MLCGQIKRDMSCCWVASTTLVSALICYVRCWRLTGGDEDGWMLATLPLSVSVLFTMKLYDKVY